MIIRTAQRNFTVVEVLRKTQFGESSVCRDMETGTLYDLSRLPETSEGLAGLPLLMLAKSNSAFSDLVEVFTLDNAVWAQFVHGQGLSLKEFLAQRPLGLLERLTIASNLLRGLVIQKMPTQVAAAVTNSHHVLVDNSLSVSFRYVIDCDDLVQGDDMAGVQRNLERLFRLLFANELDAQSAPKIEQFIKRLHHGDFDTYLDAYATFDPIHEELRKHMEEGEVEPRTLLFRIWKRIKYYFKLIKPLLIGLVIVASFCYLVYTLLAPSTYTGTPILFDSIGTVEILPQNVAE